MGADHLTSEQVARIAQASAEAAIREMYRADGDDEAPSLVELWADHFSNVEIRRDYVIDHWLRDQERRGVHLDTSTALFAQQLEAILAKSYDKPYPANLARGFLPPPQPVPNGAETVSTYGYDLKGEATILSSYGEDVRRAQVDGTKTTWKIVGIAASWALTVQQARASAMAGMPLDARGLMAARRLIENKIDALLASGDSDAGLDGFLALTTGASGCFLENKTGDLTGDWDLAATTVANIEADVLICIANFDGDGIYVPTNLLLDPATYTHWKTRRLGTENDTSILSYISSAYGLQIDKWHKLSTASAGSAKRAVFYVKDDEVVSPIISQEPEQLPSVWNGLGWETIMHARCGGVMVNNPRGILYADHED